MDKLKRVEAEVEKIMAEEMDMFEEACKNGEADTSSAPVVYTRMQMLLSVIKSLQEEPDYDDSDLLLISYMDGVGEGKKIMKQQMMKNAVLETEVYMDADGDGIETEYSSWLALKDTEIPEIPESLGLKDKDKVVVLVVKKD